MTGAPRGRARRALLPLAACVLVAAATVVPAATVKRWSTSSAAALATGTLDGALIDAEGRVRLAPDVHTLWGPDEGIVWSIAVAGDTALVGLSGPGRVLRVTVDGDGGAADTLLDVGAESLITAVAAADKRGVYAGRSPEGEILHVTRQGEVRSRGTTDAKFVWAMTTDARGELWIGTGVPGRVLRNPDAGVIVEALATGDDPVRSLAPFPGGGVVAGTGGRGRVIRIDARNRAFVLFDADEREIVAVAAAPDGTVYALAAGGPKQVRNAAAAPRTEDNAVTVTASPPPGDDDDTASVPPPDDKPKQSVGPAVTGTAGGSLYRIDADGAVRTLWTTRTELPFDLALVPSTGAEASHGASYALLVATGDQGRIHRIDREGRHATVLRIAANQASALAATADGRVFVGGSTDARVETIDPALRDEGSYASAPIDAGTVAAWGRLDWEAVTPEGSALEFAIRAGNTDDPDETWTEWIALDGNGAGVADAVPQTRWCQIRAAFRAGRGGSPVLHQLALSYLPRNRPPIVEELQVGDPGVVWSPAPVPSTAGRGPVVADDPVARSAAASLTRKRAASPIRRSYEHGARTFAWKVGDPDDDRLTFALEIRRATGEQWLPLAHGIETPFYSWDSRAMPDGPYRTRLIASDRRDNPDGHALEHQFVSDVFSVDNTRPRIEDFRRADGTLAFDAVDADGRVVAVEVAWDGEAWEAVDPVDGLADSETESYRVPVEDGRVSVMVRVVDAAGNIGGAARALSNGVPSPSE